MVFDPGSYQNDFFEEKKKILILIQQIKLI